MRAGRRKRGFLRLGVEWLFVDLDDDERVRRVGILNH